MSETFANFQESIGRLSPAVDGSRVEILLRLIDQKTAELLRLSAIPHEFTPGILPILLPGLNDSDEMFEKVAAFPFITILNQQAVIHDQVRKELFISWLKKEKEDLFKATSNRLVEFFESHISAASGRERELLASKRMFHLTGADVTKGFQEFESLCRTARHQNRFSDCHSLIRLVHEYDPVLPEHFRANLAYHEAKLAADLRNWQSAEQLFSRIAGDETVDHELRSKALFRLGVVSSDQGQNERAVELYNQALQVIPKTLKDSSLAYRIGAALGAAYRELGQLSEAQAMLETSLKQALEARDQSEMATIYNGLGTLYSKLRNPRQAILSYTTSLQCLAASNDKLRAAQVHNNLGTVYSDHGEWQKAEEEYQRSLEISREGSDTWAQAKVLLNLSRLYQGQNISEKAIEVCQQAIGLFRELADFRKEALAQRNLGRLFLASNRITQARTAFADAISLFQRCSLIDEACGTQQELDAIGGVIGLPWWAWGGITLLVLLILLLILTLVLVT